MGVEELEDGYGLCGEVVLRDDDDLATASGTALERCHVVQLEGSDVLAADVDDFVLGDGLRHQGVRLAGMDRVERNLREKRADRKRADRKEKKKIEKRADRKKSG